MVDILNTDLSGVDISRPVIEGTCLMRVVDLRIEPNKAGDGQNLTFNLVLEKDAVATNGKVVHPGFGVTGVISLKATEKYNDDAILSRLKQFRLCFTGKEDGSFAPLEQYIGRTGYVRLRREQGGDGVERTGVAAFLRPPVG